MEDFILAIRWQQVEVREFQNWFPMHDQIENHEQCVSKLRTCPGKPLKDIQQFDCDTVCGACNCFGGCEWFVARFYDYILWCVLFGVRVHRRPHQTDPLKRTIHRAPFTRLLWRYSSFNMWIFAHIWLIWSNPYACLPLHIWSENHHLDRVSRKVTELFTT